VWALRSGGARPDDALVKLCVLEPPPGADPAPLTAIIAPLPVRPPPLVA
jgi:hypothetical protein